MVSHLVPHTMTAAGIPRKFESSFRNVGYCKRIRVQNSPLRAWTTGFFTSCSPNQPGHCLSPPRMSCTDSNLQSNGTDPWSRIHLKPLLCRTRELQKTGGGSETTSRGETQTKHSICLKDPDLSPTYRDKVRPREVPDDSSRRADAHVADDRDEPSTEATSEASG